MADGLTHNSGLGADVGLAAAAHLLSQKILECCEFVTDENLSDAMLLDVQLLCPAEELSCGGSLLTSDLLPSEVRRHIWVTL